ncbi:alpha/beta hydrolase [Thermosipho ferrireducens]|uniref:Alpha/beta hydrolase n=1 Tax=Thermosipho ferrireducens TaxID=2571116 RepID=A0ABX7S4J1_9BACT|nr:alpha/beta hydrolase [Thermosipho ferrireducens]QTA37378.1 alpha/beta hydrolase [Thermosipho ferrireducens]
MKNLKLYVKRLLYLAIFLSAFVNIGIFIFIIVILNIPLIKRTVLGKLPIKVPKKSWEFIKTVQYKKRLFMDILYPSSGMPPFPVVIFAHGGGWITGYRRQPNNISWYNYLVFNGLAVVSIDYRYGYLYDIEDLLDDYEDAINYIYMNAPNLKLDPKNISLMGLSAGGHLALCYTFIRNNQKRPTIKNIVAYYAPSNLLDLWSHDSTSIFAKFAVATTLKRIPGKSRELYMKYSPINFVPKKNSPPILLVHGMKDNVVPVKSSIKLYKTLKTNGTNAKILLHPEGNHGFEFVLKDELTKKILQKTVEFLKEVI